MVRKRKSKTREFSYSEVETALSYHSDVVFLGRAFANDNKSPMYELFIYKKDGKLTIEDTVSKRVSQEDRSVLGQYWDLHMKAGYLLFKALSDEMAQKQKLLWKKKKKILERRARKEIGNMKNSVATIQTTAQLLRHELSYLK